MSRLLKDERNSFRTVECCLAEIMGWTLNNNQNFEALFKIIRANSEIIMLRDHDWIDAGKERFEQRRTQKDFGFIDAAILVKQKEFNCKIVSGDKHFMNIKDIVFLKE